MSEVTEVLIHAKNKVEEGWTKKYLAIDQYGNAVEPTDSDAVCWCAIGAIDASTNSLHAIDEAEHFLSQAIDLDPCEIWEWNDEGTRTQEDVLAAFDRAIELSREMK